MSEDYTDPIPRVVASDEARRAADIINMHIIAQRRGFVAIRLSDGGSDNVVYDTKDDAVRHQLHPQQCAYFQLQLTPIVPWECDVFLLYTRQMYAAGHRVGEEGAPSLIIPSRTENIRWNPPRSTMNREQRRRLKGF